MKVFLSYARRDGTEHVRKLDEALKNCGLFPWYDIQIDETRPFPRELEDHIQSSAAFILCLTKGANESQWVENEIVYARSLVKTIYIAKFEEGIELPLTLNTLTPIDFFNEHFEFGVSKLCDKFTVDPFRQYIENKLIFFRKRLKTVLADDPIDIDLRIPSTSKNPLPDHHAKLSIILSEFDHNLLLMGAPGSGKSIALMTYAQRAYEARISNPSKPLPLFGRVKGWYKNSRPTEKEQSGDSNIENIARWLAFVNDLPQKLIQTEIEAGHTLLLLDGLDELGHEDERLESMELYNPFSQFLTSYRTPNKGSKGG